MATKASKAKAAAAAAEAAKPDFEFKKPENKKDRIKMIKQANQLLRRGKGGGIHIPPVKK